MRKDPPPDAFDKFGLAWVAFLELDHDVLSSMIIPVYKFLYGSNATGDQFALELLTIVWTVEGERCDD